MSRNKEDTKELINYSHIWIPNYSSKDKTYWGPHYWFVFHTYSENYPDSPTSIERETANYFIKSIPFLLPCNECKSEAYFYIKAHVELLDIIVSCKTEMVKFFRRFHDYVNAKTGKPIYYPDLQNENTS